jgi:hypothetical protein
VIPEEPCLRRVDTRRVLRARVHARPLNNWAKRWCLAHLRPAVTGLGQIGGAVRIDTSHQPPDRLAGVVASALERHGGSPT